jgi:hypothetical protein
MIMRTYNNNTYLRPGRVLLLAVLLLLGCITAHSQSTITITIGGDIYGGGRNGAVGTSHADNPDEANATQITLNSTDTATNVVINKGQVRTVFGGGENGRVYGSTSVTVKGGTIGDPDWDNTIHGGVFGAGDGQSAIVFGHSRVTMEGGTVFQNIYGGGNQADLVGTTSVTLKGGNILSTVYGGARVADINGYSLVDINGTQATNDLIINAVYGGNDIGGSILLPNPNSHNWEWIKNLQVPSVISQKAKTPSGDNGYGIDNTWNAFVHATGSASRTIYVGQLYGGGNGFYTYGGSEGAWTMSSLKDRHLDNQGQWVAPAYEFSFATKPIVGKVYLELEGGNYGYVYGGGNNATVTGSTVLCLNNSTESLATIETSKLSAMDINLDVDKQAYTITGEGDEEKATLHYQFDRVFGGNKQAAMAIHPEWHLEKANINNLYSGGDAGNMTHSTGLFLALTSSNLTVKNVYGGCRIADVAPSSNEIGRQTYTVNGEDYTYEAGYSARILITAGNITNVYGGNDISGNVYGGTALEILSSISGEVYGGGNGSYVYTDIAALQDNDTYRDFYYDPGQSSIDALNAFRPSTSKAFIHIAGTDDQHRTTVTTLYGGGNSTTVSDDIKLLIGNYVTIGNIFLGSNGEHMKSAATLASYADNNISTLNFKDGQGTFDKYMLGTAVSSQPTIDFDGGYPQTRSAENESKLARVGSFYCGGNVGSMTSDDPFNIQFKKPIILTNKLVGGCNTAFVEAGTYNDRHEGGFIGGDSSHDKIYLDIDGIIFENEASALVGNQGNIFGGCFESGIMVGNVTIDLKENIIPAGYFDDDEERNDYITDSGNLFDTHFSVFGGGFGPNASVQGNTTVKVHDSEFSTSGGAIKVFGGGYGGTVDGNATVSIYGDNSFVGRVYGGGFEGLVTGNTAVNLDGGTVYHSFGGACNANITGYAQTYLGAGLSGSNGYATVLGNVYGGNDFGGSINGSGSFYNRIPVATRSSVYNPGSLETPYVVNASAYVEYQQGKITGNIFGGSCGAYSYGTINHNHTKPYLANAFVNFIPTGEDNNAVQKIFGAGEGSHGTSAADNFQDKMQDRSYILVDMQEDEDKFTKTDVFGAGANSGLGMRLTAQEAHSNTDAVTAVIDLVKGQIQNAYGASFSEGVTRRTVINVPENSSAILTNIFGGGYGDTITSPCDAIETVVNYNSPNAIVLGAVYGGNNNCRRTLYSQINVSSKLRQRTNDPNYTGYIYGGGKGANTWSFYTEVNMLAGANAYGVYGGGDKGNVLNRESFEKWIPVYANQHSGAAIYSTLGSDYDTQAAQALLDADLIHANKLDTITNTNVYFYKDSYVGGYAYGGGKESHVSGATYIGLHGGIISKDMYAAGESGDVRNLYGGKFTAVANAFVEGGQARRVYGGGWKGNVGHTELPFSVDQNLLNNATALNNILKNDDFGISNVVIGISPSEASLRNIQDYGFYHGIPAVEWNAYGAGERGGIIGTAKLTLNNGYIGYRYFPEESDNSSTAIDERYHEKLDDETADDGVGRNYLIEHGNLFGGGYDDGSYADTTIVKVYDGYVRNSVYGGGEIAAVGRGETKESGTANSVRELKGIYKPGKATATIYGGHIHRNVFGGGKGYSATRAEEYAYSATKRYTDGYVFGQTEANVYGGVIGTTQTLKDGDGNVFGGGNIGYVYTKIGKKWTETENNVAPDSLYYLVKADGTWDLKDGEKQFSEDAKVVVSPYSRVKDNQTVTLGGKTYKGAHMENGKFIPAQYVPIEALNTVTNKNSFDKTKIDVESGIIIRNAVFAGGNVSQGSDLLYAEAKTVFGNATASIIDLYCMDLVTLGQEGIGGLYGDGNLTFVDGYRELNITNYGTDYYGLTEHISYQDYLRLNDRERAYFQLQYKCATATGQYAVDAIITADEYNNLTTAQQECFVVDEGVCSIYAGRMMNTVQRADYLGVFGSRMVMKGARDRVPSEVDYTNYTINRVGEVALHQTKVGDATHGNYFGIYNIVNYLGALTSDLAFNSQMEQSTEDVTYYEYKSGKKGKQNRNKGTSHNEVALASGVYLELLQEPKRNYVGDQKIYGPITGIVQLNLIAAATGEGGGYVYAKNVHGTQHDNGKKHLILAKANQGAITYRAYDYDQSLSTAITTNNWMQSSGNFVSTQTIIDECFPTANSYYEDHTDEYSPAHYWFIKGDFYVYNQEISAYTGSAQAYIENVSMPLTILAQGNAKLFIEDIKTNLYADSLRFPAGADSVICNGITYYGNDPINYWDYNNLSSHDKQYFVDKSYVCVTDVYSTKADAEAGENMVHHKGEVFQPTAYNNLAKNWYDNKGNAITKDRAFRLTNALNRTNGYLLAVSLDQPELWNEYYTHHGTDNENKKTSKEYGLLDDNAKAQYKLGPTYHLNGAANTSYIFGQSEYSVSDLIDKGLYDKYEDLDATAKAALSNQAKFEAAYMALTTCDITVGSKVYHVVERSAIPKSRYDSIQDATQKSYFAKAYVGLETMKLSDKLLLSSDQLYSFEELSAYALEYPDQIKTNGGSGDDLTFDAFPRAYYCTTAGNYGGTAFTSGQNYQAAMYTNLNKTERANFTFNFDGLDIMYDSTYAGNIEYYDKDAQNAPLYSGNQQIDYKVIYTGANGTLYGYGTGYSLPVTTGETYTRQQFEQLANEKRHYVQITTNTQDWDEGVNTTTLYVVHEEFGKAGRVYNYGEVISDADYTLLNGSDRNYISTLRLTRIGTNLYKYKYDDEEEKEISGIDEGGKIECYLCTDGYTKPNDTENVGVHTLISKSSYNLLKNYQEEFEVVAAIPREKSALYVSRDCDIYDFTEDRIFTVIYRYSYSEPDDATGVYRNVSERHILNIRVHFESGEPIIGELLAPSKLIPGSVIGLTKPSVQKGAFEVLGGGWELYENENNALTHKNGIPYNNYVTPMYWYQNQWYVAYYAETYLGRTFSNAVPFTVVNYHDIDKVMADTVNHLHIDHPSIKVNSRIYIDNRTASSDNTRSKLDLLYDLFDLSLQDHGQTQLIDEEGNPVTDDQDNPVLVDNYAIHYNRGGELKDTHYALNEHVRGLANLEFILNSDVEPKKYTSNTDWKQIGTDAQCFEGTLHGNGYTVSGINKSLFKNMCGEVYNLGVRGSIVGSGIADGGDGYAQNCWLINESTADLHSYNAIMNSGTIVNGYYNDEAAKNANAQYVYASGAAISKPMSSFINGEVAYNLNGFYLNKRNKDHDDNGGGTPYWYYTVNQNNTLSEPQQGHTLDTRLYVENYYMDGQYVYAGGSIPSGINERFSDKEGKHYPIYPDDYIYFGQKLTYDIDANSEAHDVQPKPIKKSSQRIDKTATGNRVYRAPAYFGSSQKDEAYFNPNVAFAATYQGTDAYAGMTAIDFTGYNDNTWTDGSDQSSFFQPTLDCGDIVRFNVKGLTQNLLVYATGQNTVLANALTGNEPAFGYTNSDYKTVAAVTDANTQKVKGHLVDFIDNHYVADGSHFLVDKQDFNAPISYSYTGSYKMWYQRLPEQYVTSMSNGWEAISLPFTAEVVTTQNKGEITHFYSGNNIGHEYWLREFKDVADDKIEFKSLAAGNTNKTVTNTYLWDYYYSKNSSKDKNQDDYQTYYNTSRQYNNYQLYQAATPYLIGFPGSRYYEFDLSGNFVAQNTAQTGPAQIGRQTITFVSKSGQTIAVTDGEYNVTPDDDGYAYHPIYQTKTVANAYVVTDGGTKFTKTASVTTVPFRAYLTKTTPASPAQSRTATRAAADIEVLYISNLSDNDQMEQIVVDRSLNAYAEGMAICIESTLETPATITITSASGKLLKQFTIQPGTKVTVPVNSRGIYIVNRHKVAVTK